jgi:tetratricopeptide (TPR) repeat protein
VKPGDLIDDRFEVEREAGAGGMGTIYRARDRRDGAPVAVKVLRAHDGQAKDRFEREAQVLAELDHPGIVRYVAHGAASSGAMYLAMEWLEGEDLERRLRRDGLTVAEGVALAARVADALGAAHARGVVHRDVKPSNLFLSEGRLDRIVLLDFGVARLARTAIRATRTGVTLGTPGYMAPEQARGERHIDARADVFSLGCVLFECLTGRPPFFGDHVMAVLAKILLEDAPRLGELCADVPDALEALVARMLAKKPSERPPNGRALAVELSRLTGLGTTKPERPNRRSTALTEGEQRIASVVLLGSIGQDLAKTLAMASPFGEAVAPSIDMALTLAEESTAIVRLREVARAYGARFETLLDGSAVVTQAGASTATDQAARAAACALALRVVAPSVPMVLASGRAELSGRLPVGHAIDRAVRLLRAGTGSFDNTPMPDSARNQADREFRAAARSATPPTSRGDFGVMPMTPVSGLHGASIPPPWSGGAASGPQGTIGGAKSLADASAAPSARIRIDDVTARLLDGRFDVSGDAAVLFLHGWREHEAARTLLGRPTPFVGRDVEIDLLSGIFGQCISEPVARAVLVTSPAGMGKSRLRHEFLFEVVRQIEMGAEPGANSPPSTGREASSPPMDAARGPVEIWMARGDPMSAGSAFGLLAQALRRTAGLRGGEPIAVRQQKLRTRVERHVAAGNVARITEFLGEMVATPFPDEESVQLREARKDPILMGDQMRRAWEDFVAAECAARPVLLVLEDLHWGDLPTVTLVDAALRLLAERPLMVLAIARPEVHDLFPGLWSERDVQVIRLQGLTRKASERLIKSALDDTASAETVGRLIDQAAGNAFYLEELIRAVAAGQGEALPETVLAMVEARIDKLDPELRRVLRAASIFGRVFWLGGVIPLLGGIEPGPAQAWLEELSRLEIVSRRVTGKLSGESEYTFRHAIVREAAYAMLTDGDRALGHRLAAEWLERAGETDAMALGEHFERGAERARALEWYRRAAEQALGGNDFEAAIARAERGIRCGAEGEALGALRRTQAEAHRWRAENIDAERCALEALRLLPRGTTMWYRAAVELAFASTRLDHTEQLVALGEELQALLPGADAAAIHTLSAAQVVDNLFLAGRYALAEALLAACEAVLEGDVVDPEAMARMHVARSWKALVAGDAATHLHLVSVAAGLFEEAGDSRNACKERANIGCAYNELGAYAEAERVLVDALATADRMGLRMIAAAARNNLGRALGQSGRLDDARRIEAEAASSFKAQGDRRMEGGSRIYLAVILTAQGDLEAAEREVRLALDLLVTVPQLRAHALAAFAHVLLAEGRPADALAPAREAMDLLAELGGMEEGEAFVRLVFAESLDRTGDRGAARAILESSRAQILARADKISDPSWRRSYLESIPEHARTLTLASAWLG